jgi:hypothetical protein
MATRHFDCYYGIRALSCYAVGESRPGNRDKWNDSRTVINGHSSENGLPGTKWPYHFKSELR